MRRALLIVGKAPRAGQAKTRLIPPLSAEDAADLYRGFLLDSVKLGLDLGWERVCVVHPAGAAEALADLLPPQVGLHEQPGQGLRDAFSSAFAYHFDEGFDRVVLIGSDNPTLPPEPVHDACEALEKYDLSIGPTTDGGYYLLGMREANPGVFDAIDWSTPRVYAQTLSRAERLGLRVHAVREWYDVDEPADLERLRQALESPGDGRAPNTRAVLERLSLSASAR